METETESLERQINETKSYIEMETKNLTNLLQRLDAFEFKLADLRKKESEVKIEGEEF